MQVFRRLILCTRENTENNIIELQKDADCISCLRQSVEQIPKY